MTARKGCDCPHPGFPSRDLARRVHHRMVKARPITAGPARPVYFKRGPCGLWHWFPKTNTVKDQT